MEPLVELEQVKEPAPAWSELKGFFPPEPGLPAPVRALPVGSGLQQAHQVLTAIGTEGDEVKGQIVGGRRVMHVIQLRDFPAVAASVVFDASGEAVESIQLTLPSTDGETALIRAWGEAAGLVMGANGADTYAWQGPRHQYLWSTKPGDAHGRLLIEALPDDPK